MNKGRIRLRNTAAAAAAPPPIACDAAAAVDEASKRVTPRAYGALDVWRMMVCPAVDAPLCGNFLLHVVVAAL